MPFTSLAELQAELDNWTGRTLSARAPDFVRLAERDFNRKLDLRSGMESEQTVTANANYDLTNLTRTLIGIRSIHIDGDPDRPLEYLTPDKLHSIHLGSDTGKPRNYTVEGDTLVFGPEPDAEYVFKILYAGEVPALTSTSANAVLTNAPDIYLFGALTHAYHYLREYPQAQAARATFEDAVEAWKRQQKRSKYTSGAMRARTRASTP